MRFNLSSAVLSAAAATTLAMPTLSAQDPKPVPAPGGWPAYSVIWSGSANRAVLGVTLAASSRADTAGVRIDDVDTDGPAAKAGIKTGDVITEINGVSLRVSAADAEDPALAGIAQRRLQRTLAKAKPGDEVDLRVRTGAAAPRALKVKTVSPADLEGNRITATSRARTSTDSGAAIGVAIGASGSSRDTLGLFVSSVIPNGPAEKAGLIEGERIAAVNGVDVRVPKEDFEDLSATSARLNRFTREVQKVAPGGTVNLRVYSNGRYREVAVKAVKRSELPPSGMGISIGDGGFHVIRGGTTIMPRMQFAPNAGVLLRPGGQVRIRTDDNHFEFEPYEFMVNGKSVKIDGKEFKFDAKEFEKSMEKFKDQVKEFSKDMKFEYRGTASRRALISI